MHTLFNELLIPVEMDFLTHCKCMNVEQTQSCVIYLNNDVNTLYVFLCVYVSTHAVKDRDASSLLEIYS